MTKCAFAMLLLGSAVSAAEKPPTDARPGALALSLKQAIQIAISPGGNPALQAAQESVRIAEAQSARARAALRPEVEGAVAGQNQKLNLAALGFESVHLPLPGFTFPTAVGPFNTFDARARVRQNLVDVHAILGSRAARANVQVAEAETTDVRDQLAAKVAGMYMSALRSENALRTANAEVTLAEALLKQAEDRRDAGKGLTIDVTRAKSELASHQQRRLAAEIETTRRRLELLKTLGLSLDTQLELSDPLTFHHLETLPLEKALAVALQSRADVAAQQKRESSARLRDSATRSERFPTLVGYADYGALGSTVANSAATYTVGVSVRVPIFDGGRRSASRAETIAQIRQEQLHERDLTAQVELEIREALESLRLAEQQALTAQEGLSLARDEFSQARRRYEAGLTAIIDVVDAQARLARAEDSHTAALYTWNQARIGLLQAMGTIRELSE